jgi:hypothetical protein
VANSVGILKPDIVFFGEGLPDIYHRSIDEDKLKCDLLIVIGSSLKVKPVANIPHLLKPDVPQILINRESLKHLSFDVELLGDCDVIVNELLNRLEEKRLEEEAAWNDVCKEKERLTMLDNDESEQIFFGKKPSDETQENVEETQNERVFTLDYLKENSFLHLKPNMYVFHGAEMSVKGAKKKLRSLRKRMNPNGELNCFSSNENSNDSVKSGLNKEPPSDYTSDSDEFSSSDSTSSTESDSDESNQDPDGDENNLDPDLNESKSQVSSPVEEKPEEEEINQPSLNEENERRN